MASRSIRAGFGVATLALIGGAASVGPVAAFTEGQATEGRALYEAQCAACHGRNLEGGEAPQLIGVDTMQNFDSAGGLYSFISVAMPPSAPGQLGTDAYLAIVAHIMQVNGGQPDGVPLPADEDALHAITIANLGRVTPTPSPAPAPAVVAAAVPSPGAIPQAFTWGVQLPGGPAPAAAVAAAPAAVPQAFTWGMQLPGAAPAVAAAAGPAAPGVPQAFTWGTPLPTVTAAAEPSGPSVPQAFTWGTPLPTVN